MATIEYNRSEARKKAEKTAHLADMKQHADKIFQGLEKLDEHQAKRAIWELFQNAIDLSEKCEIIITLTNEAIEFKHNGEPFTSETLIHLIKQVSSKDPESNDGQVGQYGTGFITTHSFGKKILLSGSLREEDFYIPLKNFEIDRIAKKSDELVVKLKNQQDEVFKLIEKGEQKKEKEPFTTFKYLTTNESEKQYAKETILNLERILPYVMVLTTNLHKVTVIDDLQNKTVYEKQGISLKVEDFSNDLMVTSICINNTKIKKIYSISSQDQNITIILPLDEQYSAFSFDDKLSKLFLFYPLIGTEDFGFNFLVHSKLFAPTEPRDGIYLRSNNETRNEKEKHNRDLLRKIFEELTKFINNHCDKIQNIHLFAKINFNTQDSNNPLLSDYFKEIKEKWVDKFKTFPLVETTELKLNPKDTLFFSEELLEKEDYFDSIYAIVNLFWENIPKKEIAKVWTIYVEQWESSIEYINIKQIVEKIKETKTLDFYKDENVNDLKRFYEYLIETHRSEIFDEYEILPNIKNEFRKKTELNIYPEINEKLIEIADVIIPNIPKSFVKNGFEFIPQFKSYGMEEFVDNINAEIRNIVDDDKSTDNILDALMKYCSIFPNISEENSMRNKLLKLVIEYYKKNIEPISLSGLPEKWWLTPTKCLFRLFAKELNTKNVAWIKENEQILYDLLSIVCSYYEFKETLEQLSLFPSQKFRLCKQNDLEIDQDIPDELKNWYDEIVQNEPIRDTLILKNFGIFLKHEKNKTPEILGNEIERKLKLQEYNDENINQHEYIHEIIDIIKLISSDKKWEQFFPTINNKKASIMLARISEKETKEDLFSIISLKNDKIRKLGELAKKDNFEDIIKKGEDAVEAEKQRGAEWQHKKDIGLYIQEEVRKRIKYNLEKFKIENKIDEFEAIEKQGGQDIIIAKYNEKPMYYIEVKSRWTQKSSIEISKKQMKTAIENKNIYSLCCVDMNKYREKYNQNGYDANIKEIEEFIKVLFDVGKKIDSNLRTIIDSEKDNESEISLSEGYRGNVPQELLKNEGKTLKDLISKLVEVCSKSGT